MSSPTLRSRCALPVAALLALAACGSDDGPTPPDTRCGGLAQVAAWRITFNSAIHSNVVSDSLDLRLNDSMTATDTTAAGTLVPGSSDPDGRAWLGGTPGGSLSAHDTLIISTSHDTIIGSASAFAASILIPSVPGMLISADLSTCHIDFGGQLSALMVISDTGATTDTATVFLAYVRSPSVLYDSTVAANGFALASQKVFSPLESYPTFSPDPEYRVGSLTAFFPSTTVFDSATISFSVTPLAAAPAARPGSAGLIPGRPLPGSGRYTFH